MEITAQNVAIGYSESLAENLNFEVKPGAILGLVGANGTGKTTLLRSILGLTPLLSGTVHMTTDLDELRRTSAIGVVWQDAGLPFNITTQRWISHLASLHSRDVAADLLQKLAAPAHGRQIRTLSGGEKQRLAIYSAFFHEPELLILDEPTVGLDESTREVFYELMVAHADRGGCAIVTSHYAVDISAISSSVLNLSDNGELQIGAIFNTASPLLEDVVQRYALKRLTNGYQTSSDNPWQTVSALSAETGIEITNYRLVTNA